jgi:hypothetical protein
MNTPNGAGAPLLDGNGNPVQAPTEQERQGILNLFNN